MQRATAICCAALAVFAGCGRIVDMRLPAQDLTGDDQLTGDEDIDVAGDGDDTTPSDADGDVDGDGDGDSPPLPSFAVGLTFNGHPGERENGPVLATYSVVRLAAYEPLVYLSWWTGVDTYDWTLLDAWVGYHAGQGARGMLMMEGVPRWASSNPDAPNSEYPALLGGNQAIATQYYAAYGRMIQATLARYANFWMAVEGWSQAVPGSGSFQGTGTELAEMQRIVYASTKAHNPALPVLSPAIPLVIDANADAILSVRTGDDVPIRDFFDWVAYHPYNAFGDAGGPPGRADLRPLHDWLVGYMNSEWGFAKPLYVTGWGVYDFGGPPIGYCQMTQQQKATALYEVLKTSQELGERGFIMYSYDNDETAGTCRSITTCTAGAASWRGFEPFSYDPVVADGITRAFDDFARD